MPHETFAWLTRIKAVEREHATVRFAIGHLLGAAKNDASVLARDLRLRDIRDAADRLDGTYVIRLFAEFEAGLRSFWLADRERDPPSRTRDLLDGIAARCKVAFDDLNKAHVIREYRNALVHERDESLQPIPIPEARGFLCRFFRYLPPTW